MTVADQMLATHPKVGFAAAQDALLRCIEACVECGRVRLSGGLSLRCDDQLSLV